MKIAFWSNAHEQANVSHNLAAVSVACVIRYPYTVAVMENHLRKDNLGWAYYGCNKSCLLHDVGVNYYEGGGIEGLLRKIYRGNHDQAILKSYLKDIIQDHLYYIPQSGIINSALFDYEFNLNSAILFSMLEEAVDIYFIDTASFNSLSSKSILEDSDLIVVNLCQSKKYIDDFFHNYSSLIPKSVFILGSYSFHSMYTCKRIAHNYGLLPDNITPIPENELFDEACVQGRAVEFITRNYMCVKDNPNNIFIQSIKRATAMIMRRVGFAGTPAGMEFSRCGL